MKKTLLSLGLAAMSFGMFSQTDGEKTGNLIKGTDGYIYNYGGASFVDPDASPAVTFDGLNWLVGNGIHNTFSGAGYTTSGDVTATNGLETGDDVGSLKVNFNGQGAFTWMSSRFSDPAGNPMYSGLSIAAGEKIRAHVYNNESTEAQIIIAIAADKAGGFDVVAGDDDPYKVLEPGEWTEVEFTIPTVAGFDYDKIYGYSLRVLTSDKTDPDFVSGAFTGDIFIEWIEFGSAVGTKSVTGLEDNASATGFEVYPNPAQNVVNFNYTVNGTATVDLSNSLGSVVSSTEGTTMNVAELPAGIYFATLNVNGVATAVQRVQVQ